MEDHSICAGCLDKGTTCLSQEYINDPPPQDAGSSALGHRLGKVEMLLEKLMEKFSHAAEGNRNPSASANVLTPAPTPVGTYDSQRPFASLFDDVPGQQANASTSTLPMQLVPFRDQVHLPVLVKDLPLGGLRNYGDGSRQSCLVKMMWTNSRT